MRYTPAQRDQKLALAREFSRCGMTKHEFAIQHGLTVNSLDHWLREVRKGPAFFDDFEEAFREIKVVDDLINLPDPSQPVEDVGRSVTVTQTVNDENKERHPDLELELPFGITLRLFGVAPR